MSRRTKSQMNLTENKECTKQEETILVALRFAQMVGTLQTLGNLPEDYFQKHQKDLLRWACEYADEEKKDVILFFEQKIAQDYGESY